MQNFRNFKDFKVELEKFFVIIGPNNIEKTNFLKAIELALSHTRFQSSTLKETDFCVKNKPIIIEIQFCDLIEYNHPFFKNYN